MPLLETDRLILRPVTLADAPAVQKYFNDWEIIKHLSMDVPWPYPDDGAAHFIEHHVLPLVQNKKGFVWAVTIKAEGDELVGIIDFRLDTDKEGNRGFWLARKAQGHGYMTEAIIAVQDFLFLEYGLDKFNVVNAKDNPNSRRVKEKTKATFVKNIELEHHSGEKVAELWEVTKENWIRENGFREKWIKT